MIASVWGFELEQHWSNGAFRMGCASPKFTLGRGPNWSRFLDATVCLAHYCRNGK